jgi:hypothetical protein
MVQGILIDDGLEVGREVGVVFVESWGREVRVDDVFGLHASLF